MSKSGQGGAGGVEGREKFLLPIETILPSVLPTFVSKPSKLFSSHDEHTKWAENKKTAGVMFSTSMRNIQRK